MPHSLVSDTLTVHINSFGAELCSVKNKEGLEFIWQANPEVWARHAPVLFPIVGKLKENIFRFKDNTYELGQHGFARDMEFSLIESSPSACVFELRANSRTKAHYPFDFVLRIGYMLQSDTITTSYTVINPSSAPIFFSIGAHPAFNCPLLPSEDFEDYYLQFESQGFKLTGLNNGLTTPQTRDLRLEKKKLVLTRSLFDQDALVFENSQINTISLHSSKSAHRVTMDCTNWPYFGIWSKKGADAFVCLEPWYGIADPENGSKHLSKKKGILCLEAKKLFSCSFSLSFA